MSQYVRGTDSAKALEAERYKKYPLVMDFARIIPPDTVSMLVGDNALQLRGEIETLVASGDTRKLVRLLQSERVGANCVSVWRDEIGGKKYGGLVVPILPGTDGEIYFWDGKYDADLLGVWAEFLT